MGVAGENLYIKIDRNIVISDRSVTLGDIAKMECTDGAVLRQLKQLNIYRFPDTETGKKKKTKQEVFSILKIIEQIHAQYPGLHVINMGESDFIVEYIKNPKGSKLREGLLVALLSVVTFFGAAFAIMAFNNDAGVADVFAKLYTQVMGTAGNGVTEIEICYSIGLSIGIIVFYNHVGKKKITPDPTPLQVQLRKYEQDIDTTFIENAQRKGHGIDVK